MKEILLDYYIDGFNVEQVNCLDLSIAGACGCYNKEFYFYYLFLLSIQDNWIGKTDTNKILQKIGLTSYQHHVISEKELLDNIYSAINLKKPVLLPVKYNKLFFDAKYNRNNNTMHLLLITGYDKENELIKVRDFLFARNLVQAILNKKVDVLADLTITTKQLCDIYFESEEKNIMLIIQRIGNSVITSYNELIGYYLRKVQITVENYYNYVNLYSMSLEIVRRRLYHSVIMIGDIIERAFSNERCSFSEIKRIEFKRSIDKIFSERNVITNKIIKTIVKREKVSNSLLDLITENDKKLYDLVYETYHQVDFKEIDETQNLALDAPVLFDSEGKNAPAANAVNGKMDNDEDCWLSTYKYKEHWLIVDLGKIQQVDKIVVKHHPMKKILVTCDFKIEGSNDLQKWDELFKIKDNKEHENQIKIPIVSYRYFRSYISS